jgi:hypothetical protein
VRQLPRLPRPPRPPPRLRSRRHLARPAFRKSPRKSASADKVTTERPLAARQRQRPARPASAASRFLNGASVAAKISKAAAAALRIFTAPTPIPGIRNVCQIRQGRTNRAIATAVRPPAQPLPPLLRQRRQPLRPLPLVLQPVRQASAPPGAVQTTARRTPSQVWASRIH